MTTCRQRLMLFLAGVLACGSCVGETQGVGRKRFDVRGTVVDSGGRHVGEAALADPRVEERGADGIFRHPESFTLYSNVAAPGQGVVWFGHGAVPAASASRWEAVDWPWRG